MAEIPHEPWTAQETPYLREMSIEEWIEKNPLPGLTITQMILSREAAAFIDTYREPLGKRLSIRAHRRWRGRMKAHMRTA